MKRERMARLAVWMLLLMAIGVKGCIIVDDCAPCTKEGCFFVVLHNGEICLESVDGVVGVVAVIQPYFPEMCESLSPTSIPITTLKTTTTIGTTVISSTTTTDFSAATTTTQLTPTGAKVGLKWYWIVIITMSSFLLFFGVGFGLYKRANLKYNRHRDQLQSNDIL